MESEDAFEEKCKECRIEKLSLQKVPECVFTNILKISTRLPKCTCLEELHNLLVTNDTILFVAIYLGMCWVLLQPFRKH